MRVSIHPVLRRKAHFVEVAAVIVAFTRLDKHGQPLEALAVRAYEGHGHGARASRRAAHAVGTRAAVDGAVKTDARTFPVGQAERLRGSLSWGAALSFL